MILLAVVLVAGVAAGLLARRLHLPSVTGQILVGILLGPTLGFLFGSDYRILRVEELHDLRPFIDFALGLMAVEVGSHLNFTKLRVAARRLTLLVVFESLLTPLIVFSFVRFGTDESWHMASLLGALCVSTAPATIIAIVKETRSKGAFVKTLVAATALNNLACICLFELAYAVCFASFEDAGSGFGSVALAPIKVLGVSIALGGGIGIVLVLMTRRVVRSDRLTSYSIVALLTAVGAADAVGASVLLTCLVLGITLANITPDKEEIGHRVFENFQAAIFAAFFTVAGAELTFDHILPAGILAALVFFGRMIGKVGSARIALTLAGATERTRKWLGLALIPQAGLAVGLMLRVMETEELSPLHDTFLAVVLTVVLLNELIGPILTRSALNRSGDYQKDRARILDFLREDNITVQLTGQDLNTVITQLAHLAVRSNKLPMDPDELARNILNREEESSTCVGEGLSLPHTRVQGIEQITGAMGIHREGLRTPTPDGKPVHCVVLILTPEGKPERHLEVLSALAKAVGIDPLVQHQLYRCESPARAYEILHADDESEDFNHFLEEDGD